MATLSVLSYNLSQGLQKMKTANNSGSTPTANASDCGSIGSSGGINLSKTFNKITVVQNVLSESIANSINISNNSNVNTIVRKIKDFGMFGTVNNAAAASTTITTPSSCINTSAPTPTPTLTVTARKRPLLYEGGKVKAVSDNKSTPTVPKKPKLHTSKDVTATQKLSKKLLENINRQLGGVSAAGYAPTAKPQGTPGRKGLPLPQAVARRNARERNRVKQVNNGFAALRERIPEEVAETFEAQGNGRGSVKKLSKVETLRMAVEYIRSLERLLGFDFPIGSDRGFGTSALAGSGSAQSFSSGEDSFTVIKDEFDDLSPSCVADEEHYEDTLSHYDMDEYFNASSSSVNNCVQYLAEQLEPNQQFNPMDMLPNITTLNGQQYIRIPGTNTYQLLTADIFIGNSSSPPNSSSIDDDEQFNALIDTNCLSPAATTSSVCTAADLHFSPPSINETSAVMTTTTTSTNAPASVVTTTTTTTTETNANGECVNIAVAAAAISSLSRSPPVPQQLQQQQQQKISSPIADVVSVSTLHHNNQQLQLQATTTLSPAANELLMQTCASTTADRLNNDDRQFVAPTPPLHIQQQQHQQQILQAARMIKQEFNENDFVPISRHGNVTSVMNNHTINTTSPSATPPQSATTLIYQQTTTQQQQQQPHNQLLLAHATMSPPLDHCHTSTTTMASMLPIATTTAMSTAGLHAFYEHDQHNSFYEGVISLKKELHDVLLDTSNNTTVLSDESMMEAIDWWEAHTPKSDGDSVML